MTGREFVTVCRALLERPLPERHEEEAWFFRAKQDVLDELGAVQPALSESFSHFIHHYVADADIRRKDREYRRSQDEALSRHIDAYEATLPPEPGSPA
jgi:hypothetical protein